MGDAYVAATESVLHLIPRYRQRLIEFGIAETVIDGIDQEVLKQVDDATETAKASPPPPAEILETEVFADGGSAWRH